MNIQQLIGKIKDLAHRHPNSMYYYSTHTERWLNSAGFIGAEGDIFYHAIIRTWPALEEHFNKHQPTSLSALFGVLDNYNIDYDGDEYQWLCTIYHHQYNGSTWGDAVNVAG